jgi:hypothetical protein
MPETRVDPRGNVYAAEKVEVPGEDSGLHWTGEHIETEHRDPKIIPTTYLAHRAMHSSPVTRRADRRFQRDEVEDNRRYPLDLKNYEDTYGETKALHRPGLN